MGLQLWQEHKWKLDNEAGKVHVLLTFPVFGFVCTPAASRFIFVVSGSLPMAKTTVLYQSS